MSSKLESVFGIHAVQALVKSAPQRIEHLWFLQGRRDQRLSKLVELSEKQQLNYQFVARDKLDDLSDGNHQGVIAQCTPGRVPDENFLYELLDGLDSNPLLLVLDGITDPHNLGACLRTADAAGVHAVISPKDNAASVTGTVRKVASGAAETIPYIPVTNLVRTLKSLQQRGIWLAGTSDAAEKSVFEADFKGPLAIVMGAEGSGMRRLTQETCDFLINIPMQGSVSSLNVSVAVGVCLYEAMRQRRPSS